MNATTAILVLGLVLGGCSVILDPEQHCPPVAQGLECCILDCGGEPGWSCHTPEAGAPGGGYAECRATCASSAECSGAGSICVSGTCTTPCDPAAQTGCRPGGACHVTSSEGSVGTTCTGGGGGAEGSACVASTSCQAGHICTGDNTCRRICNVATGEGCADRECLVFPTPLMIGDVEYGFCRPCVAQGSTCCIPDCGDGWSCSSDSGGYEQCRAACASNAECYAGPGSICLVAGCSTPCDPVAQTGCRPEGSCVVYSGDDGAYTQCIGRGPGEEGTACERSTDCQVGLLCTSADVCRRICNVRTGEGCVDTACRSFATPNIIGDVEYGYCPSP